MRALERHHQKQKPKEREGGEGERGSGGERNKTQEEGWKEKEGRKNETPETKCKGETIAPRRWRRRRRRRLLKCSLKLLKWEPMKLALEPRPLFHRYQTNRQLLSNQPTTAFYLMKLANIKFSSLAANKLRSIESISYSFQHYALRRPVFLLSTSSDHMQPSSANYCLSMREAWPSHPHRFCSPHYGDWRLLKNFSISRRALQLRLE